MTIALYIFVMAAVTYIIRMVPFAFFTKKINSVFVKSLLFYMPYAVLAAMTIPAVFFSTGSIVTAVIGTITALVLAYFDLPLIVVALCAAASVFAAGAIIP